jgi:hypothetical protein
LRGTITKKSTLLLVAVATLAGVAAFTAPLAQQADEEVAPIFVTKIPRIGLNSRPVRQSDSIAAR